MKNPFMAVVHVGEAVVESGKLVGELRHVEKLVRDMQTGNWPSAARDAAPFVEAAVDRLRHHHNAIGDALAELAHAVAQGDGAAAPRADVSQG